MGTTHSQLDQLRSATARVSGLQGTSGEARVMTSKPVDAVTHMQVLSYLSLSDESSSKRWPTCTVTHSADCPAQLSTAPYMLDFPLQQVVLSARPKFAAACAGGGSKKIVFVGDGGCGKASAAAAAAVLVVVGGVGACGTASVVGVGACGECCCCWCMWRVLLLLVHVASVFVGGACGCCWWCMWRVPCPHRP